MERVTVGDVPSRWYRGLELFLILPVVLISLFCATFFAVIVTEVVTGSAGSVGDQLVGVFAGTAGILYLVMLVVLFVSMIAVPVLVYLDAGKVTKQDVDWKPSRGLYAGLGVIFTHLVVWDYLYKRHKYVVDWVNSRRWWYLALAGFGLTSLALIGGLFEFGYFLFTFLGLPLFAIGVYKDATYVRLNSDWHPNPINHFLGALFSALFVIFAPLYFGYYAYKRFRHL